MIHPKLIRKIKTCILYTKYFFEYQGNNNFDIESYDLLKLYLNNELKNNYNLEKIVKKKYLIRTNRILEIRRKFKINKKKFIVKGIFELFLTEVAINKNKNKEFTEESF